MWQRRFLRELGFPLEDKKLKLERITRRIKEAQRRRKEKAIEEAVAQAEEARARADFAAVNRAVCRIAGSGWGPAKRAPFR